MKAIFLICVLFSQALFASQHSLNGKWVLEKLECQSGAPFNTNSQQIQFSYSTGIEFSGDAYQTFSGFFFKIKSSTFEDLFRQLQEARKTTESQPDTPEKIAKLKKVDQELVNLKKFGEGLSCALKIVGKTQINDHQLSMTPSSVFATCSEFSNEDSLSKMTAYDYQIQDRSLILTEQKAVDRADHNCPFGDHVVMTLKSKE